MNKKFIFAIMASAGLVLTTGAAHAEGTVQVISKNNYFGCIDYDYQEKLSEYLYDGQEDSQAFKQKLSSGLRSGQCVIFLRGENVYITDTHISDGLMQIHRAGGTEKYWTFLTATLP